MLIDWITARVPLDFCDEADRARLYALGDRVVRFCAATGETVWESWAWDSVRSDSHQLAYRIDAGELWMQGSPARVCGDGDAVFGSGPSAALDLHGCIERMRAHLGAALEVELPEPRRWKVTRVDVTENLLLPDLASVVQALEILRGTNGGRYRISSTKGGTCYWSSTSQWRSGKAYAKGPHLTAMQKRKDYTGRVYSEAEIAHANRVLRLELSLKNQHWRERANWRETTADDLRAAHERFFGAMLGGAEMTTDADVLTKLKNACDTERRAQAAYGCWLAIQSCGWDRAREMYAKPTWYRHLKSLHAIVLGDADISAGKVVSIRKRVVECRPVSTWAELMKAA